jgi:acyl dehydratase
MLFSRDHSFHDIEEGAEYSHSYTIDETVYGALLSVFQDQSPIHIDDSYARTAGFSGCVMHGAIFNGFLSHFVGMYFPGRRSLILSVNMNYHLPSYLGDKVTLTARVRQKVETARVVVLDVKFVNQTSAKTAASGRVQILVRDEE